MKFLSSRLSQQQVEFVPRAAQYLQDRTAAFPSRNLYCGSDDILLGSFPLILLTPGSSDCGFSTAIPTCSMGKKDKASAAAVAAAKKERKSTAQAAKASKSAKKQTKKSGDADDEPEEEDIEKILASLAAAEVARTAVTITPVDRPSARANTTLTPLPSGELILCFGEFFDGHVNVCYNEVYRCGARGGDWRLVTSPTSPPPRCSHQAVLFPPSTLIIVGGEFATQNQFHHYSDTWRLDLVTNRWSRVDSKKAPSPRSGHRLAVWRSFIVLFGGFYESASQDRWFSDLWILDTRTWQWTEVTHPGHALTPSARSGHQLLTIPGMDALLLYGGYSEIKPGDTTTRGGVPRIAAAGAGSAGAAAAALLSRKSKSLVHSDLWILKMLPVASGGLPVWERIRCVGSLPPPRLAFSMAMYRDRALLFGGVSDADADERGELLVSQFYNDLYSYDVARKRWYKLDMRAAKGGGGGGGAAARRAAARSAAQASAAARASPDDDDDAVSLGSGDGTDDEEEEGQAAGAGARTLDDDAFYFVGADGKLVRVADDDDGDGDGNGAGKETPSASSAPVVSSGVFETGDTAAAPAPLSGSSISTPHDASLKQPGVAATLTQPSGASTVTLSSAPSSAPAPPSVKTAAVKTEAVVAAPAPVGRMKANMWVDGHRLFIYGGMFEGRQRETTLDDLWMLDLRDRTAWQELLPARPHAWKGDDSDDEEEEDDDDDDDEDGGRSTGSDSSGGGASSDDNGLDGSDSSPEGSSSSKSTLKTGPSPSAAAGDHSNKSGRRGAKDNVRLRQLRDQLGVEDVETTPQPGEDLRAFFARTGDTWVRRYVAEQLTSGDRIEGKHLRRRAFDVARARYDSVWPLLANLYEMEEQQRALEREMEARSRSRRGDPKAGGGGGGSGGGGAGRK